MTSSLLGAAIAMVRGWTRIYTWRLPPALRDARRAEIESDLWESGRDSDGRPSPAHVVARLLLGVPDDLRWRMAHASIVHTFVLIVVAVTTTAFLVAALWVVDLLRARKLPVPPPLRLATPAPPVAPRPSAHLQPRVREDGFMRVSQSGIRVLLSVLLVGLVTGAGLARQSSTPRLAVAVDPVTAILDGFRSYAVVALGEGAHGNEQGHAFRLSLIRDPRFSATVNDIVVEFGNARYQDVMDRFVRGEEVSDTVLREVWQNTTQTTAVWERPIYEEFFRAVRAVNASLPPGRQLRVLLGDPPIDWSTVRTFEDVNKWMANGIRDRHPAELIQREVLAKARRALIIYGEGHLLRLSPSIVRMLESSGTTRVFTIVSPFSMPMATDPKTLQADAGSWRVPGLVMLRGTVLGAAAVTSYFPAPPMMRAGKPVPADERRAPAMEEQFDALLYLGDPSTITMSRLPAARCADASYIEMRLRRIALLPSPLSKGQEDRLKQECGLPAPK